MTKSFLRLTLVMAVGGSLVPFATMVSALLRSGAHLPALRFTMLTGVWIFSVVLPFGIGLHIFLKRMRPHLDVEGAEQAHFLSSFPDRYVDVAIFGSAGLSLFLELAVILSSAV